MDLEEQTHKLPIINFDSVAEDKKENKRHGDLLPNSIRAVFCGASNCGKTNALLSLLTHPNGLKFENIYIYSKSLNQPKYKFLEKILETIEGMQYLPFSEHDLVVSPDNALPNSIMVFDDVACEKKDSVKAFFCMGRHKNVDCFYLCQSYAQVPKHLVRDNVNLLIVFRQDDLNLRHIYNDHVNTDMAYQRFKDICSSCWKEDYCFLVIDKDRKIDAGRYRKGFDKFIINASQFSQNE